MSLRTSSRTTTTAAAIAAVIATALAPATSAHADDGGSGVIRGTVLETGHAIAPGIDVSLYKSSGEFVSATVTNSQAGAYQFSDLKSGSYVLWFENQNEAVSEWYDNQPDKPQAKAIALGDGATYVADAYLTQVSENLVKPTVSGTATVGSVLTATRGSWYPTQSVEFRYQWLRGSAEIDGATAPTYTLRDADSGSRMSVEVIAVHQGATESAASTQTVTVTGGTPPEPTPTITSTTVPNVEGSTVVGSVLSATSGTWTPADATVALEWLRGATVVGTGTTYTTTAADIGATLRVRATATKTGWNGTTAESAVFGPVVDEPTPPEPPAPVSTGLPVISGTARVGAVISTGAGTWGNTPTGYAYQWVRNGAPISGATGTTLRLTAADAGKAIGVVVTATNTGGSTTATSAVRTVAKAGSKISATLGSPRKKQLTVKVAISSAGARTGKVTVVVRVGRTSVTKTYALRAGTRKATIGGLRKGRATVTIRYSGDTSTTAAQLVKKATVR